MEPERFGSDDPDAGIEATVEDWRDATPLCTRCLEPFDPLQHYCRSCGNTVGQYTAMIPFVDIPFMYSGVDLLWTRMWNRPGRSAASRVVDGVAACALSLCLAGFIGPLILVAGAPWWWRKSHDAVHDAA